MNTVNSSASFREDESWLPVGHTWIEPKTDRPRTGLLLTR